MKYLKKILTAALVLCCLTGISATGQAEFPGEEVELKVMAQTKDAVVMSLRNVFDKDAFEFVSAKTNYGHWGKNGASLIRLDGEVLKGHIGTLTLKITDEAIPGEYKVSFNVTGAYTIDEEKAKVTIEDIPIMVEDNLVADVEKIRDFVSRCYLHLLYREADPSGLEDWTERLVNRTGNAVRTVEGIIGSQEFQAQYHNAEEMVDALYMAMLGRPSDPEGKAHWIQFLESGCSEEAVINGFYGSAEFAAQCNDCGMRIGKTPALQNRDINMNLTAFVSRCYREGLCRNADEEGLNYWCGLILNGTQTTKQVVSGFVFSQEVADKNLSNEELVDMMYRLYLGREADPPGREHWVTMMENGMTLEQLSNGFADSPEFADIVAGYGL